MRASALLVPAEESGGVAGPLVTVVVPTHNYARYLPDAIASVRAQTLASWECLVVDDGSNDDTRSVADRLCKDDARLRVHHQRRLGPAAARNRALRESTGRYIQFLDADDLLHPGKLEAHVQALESMSDVDIVYGPTRYFDDAEPAILRTAIRGPERPELPPLSGPGAEVLQRLLVANPMTIEAPLVRRSLFDLVGLFDERLHRMEDWELWLRCAMAGRRFAFVAASEPVARIRLHPASVSHDETPMLLAEISIRAHLDGILQNPADRSLNKRRLDDARATAGIRLGLDGDTQRAMRLLLPAALSQRRPRWFAWLVALLLMKVPGGRRMLVALRSRRNRGIGAIG